MPTSKSDSRPDAISVKSLKKTYGKLKVLKGITFSVRQGEILALLGPNGAGKTTTVKILSTLLRADSGSASVNGHDVVQSDAQVRASIGLTGQYAAVDEYLTGRENLELIGRLYRMSKTAAIARSAELLNKFDLMEAANRPVRQYSGGMRRRLDLAMSLIANPPIIFLDEPTTGLDPRSRLTMWSMIKQLAENGTTILLTTQYMDEADHLADNIIVLDNGKVIAEGTSASLKSKIGSERLEIAISKKADFASAVRVVAAEKPKVDEEQRTLSIATKRGVGTLRLILDKLDKANIQVEGISLHSPTLDDVFLSLTGHGTNQEKEEK